MLALAGCSTGTQGTTEVDWENDDPSVKIRIEQMAASGDCAGLPRATTSFPGRLG